MPAKPNELMFTLIHCADSKIAQAIVEFMSERFCYAQEVRYEDLDFGERHSIVGYTTNHSLSVSDGAVLANIAGAFKDGANWQKKVQSYKAVQ